MCMQKEDFPFFPWSFNFIIQVFEYIFFRRFFKIQRRNGILLWKFFSFRVLSRSDGWSISMLNDHSSNGCCRKGIPLRCLTDGLHLSLSFLSKKKKGFSLSLFWRISLHTHTWHLSTPYHRVLNLPISLLCGVFACLVFFKRGISPVWRSLFLTNGQIICSSAVAMLEIFAEPIYLTAVPS